MTFTKEAQTLFSEHGLDRDDALIAAKTIGQMVIEDSQSTATPLEGMVYEVRGLYNDGTPECRFERSQGQELTFTGTFRPETGGDFVERKRTFAIEEVQALVDEATVRNAGR